MNSPPPLKHEILSDIAAWIETVDERARECNRKWGHNRLPHLVPLDWLDKFRSQKRKWELACFECCGSLLAEDRERVRKQAEAMLRAFDKLETLAVAEGYLPTPPNEIEFELSDGTPVILVRTRAEMAQIDPAGRKAQVWSLEEVATVIAKFPMIAATKDAFPGAEVVQMRTSKVVVGELNDSLADMPV